jgi:hypothetical protein
MAEYEAAKSATAYILVLLINAAWLKAQCT